MKKYLLLLMLLGGNIAFAQDDLVKKLEANKSDSAKKKFIFKEMANLANTSVKNQASSGTCWSYSTNSFLESEMIKAGKTPVELAELYTARCSYLDKADNYVRMHGAVSWGDGGECHDVINMYRKYGAMPLSEYSGLHYGTTKNKFAELQSILESMLKAVVGNHNGKLTTSWKKAFKAVVDSYLGEVPETFNWKGKVYTPLSFAQKVVGLNPDDYIEFQSNTIQPLYQKSMFFMPDNWNFESAYNIKMNDLTSIIDNALKNGYTVAWATDVSEKYFSWKNGVAFVPEKEWEDMEEEEQKALFNGPQKERVITEKLRQQGLDNFATTDDHGMHIVGTATDQKGNEYYIVKNSWGVKNDYKGYLYVSKNYVLYKTTALLINKNAVPPTLLNKLK